MAVRRSAAARSSASAALCSSGTPGSATARADISRAIPLPYRSDASAQDASIIVTFHTSRPGFETVTLRLAPYDRSFYIDDHGALVNKRDAEKIAKTFETIGE